MIEIIITITIITEMLVHFKVPDIDGTTVKKDADLLAQKHHRYMVWRQRQKEKRKANQTIYCSCNVTLCIWLHCVLIQL